MMFGLQTRCRTRWRPPMACLWLAVVLSLAGSRIEPTSCLAGEQSNADRHREYAVKAAYLYNLTQFVDWPESEEGDEIFDLWVIGTDPFAELIDQAVEGKTVHGKPFRVHRVPNVHTIPPSEDIDIAFLGADSKETAIEWTKELGNGPILVSSEVPGHAESNGVIGFYISGKNVRFEINRKNAKSRGLRISSQLLDLARLVGEGT